MEQVTNKPSYIAVLASSSQSTSSESSQQESEFPLTADMLVTNPLDERLNLNIISNGIRLPEGI